MGLSYCKETSVSQMPRSASTTMNREESKKLKQLMRKFSPNSQIQEYGFYLSDNFDDFIYIKQHDLLVFLTGDWFRYEFNRKRPPPSIPNLDRKHFSSQVLPFYSSLKDQSSIDIRNSLIDDEDKDYSRASMLAEVTTEAQKEASLLIYSLKRRKIVSRISKFSFGFSFYSRIRYSDMFKGFLILEVNLSLFVLSISGRKLTKLNFAYDKDVDTRSFEVIDSLGLIAVGTKSGLVKLFAIDNDEARSPIPSKNQNMILNLKLVQMITLPLGESQVSSLNYSEKSKILVVNERGACFYFYKWVSRPDGTSSFKPVSMHYYNAANTLVPFQYESNSRHYSFESAIRNRDIWIFEEGNKFYLWKSDIHPSEVFIWETSRLADKNQLRLATRIDWEKLYRLDQKKGLMYIEERLNKMILLSRNEVKEFILLAILVLRFANELEVFDFLGRRKEGYDIISLSVKNGKHYCRLSLL